jgi:hypothetical protein
MIPRVKAINDRFGGRSSLDFHLEHAFRVDSRITLSQIGEPWTSNGLPMEEITWRPVDTAFILQLQFKVSTTSYTKDLAQEDVIFHESDLEVIAEC